MRYSFISAAILAFTSSAFAQTANFDPISIPAQDQQVAAGSSLPITWEPSTVHTGPVTIQLLQGATPGTLEVGQTIKAGVDQTTGKYTWTVPADLKSFATYGFKITLDSTATSANPIFQFSFPFHITGLSGGSSSASAGTTTVHLSTGTGYTVVPTTSTSASVSSSSSSSSSASVNSTSTYVPATTSSAKPSATAVTTYASSGNVTLSSVVKPTISATATPTGSSPSASSTSSTVPVPASGANMARGSFAVLGGLVLAFAL